MQCTSACRASWPRTSSASLDWNNQDGVFIQASNCAPEIIDYRQRISDDLKKRWITGMDKSKRNIYLLSSIFNPSAESLSFSNGVYFSKEWKEDSEGVRSMCSRAQSCVNYVFVCSPTPPPALHAGAGCRVFLSVYLSVLLLSLTNWTPALSSYSRFMGGWQGLSTVSPGASAKEFRQAGWSQAGLSTKLRLVRLRLNGCLQWVALWGLQFLQVWVFDHRGIYSVFRPIFQSCQPGYQTVTDQVMMLQNPLIGINDWNAIVPACMDSNLDRLSVSKQFWLSC